MEMSLKNRPNAQKPNQELLASFKASHGDHFAQSSGGISAAPSQSYGGSSQLDALDVAFPQSRQFDDTGDMKDADPTPRITNEDWRISPGFFDAHHHNFPHLLDQNPMFFTPNSGGANYHSIAGDLHTPSGGFTLGLGTPLSMPNSESIHHSGQTMHQQIPDFNPPTMPPHQIHNHPHFDMQHAQAYPPAQFQHQPPEYGQMGPTRSDSQTQYDEVQGGMGMQEQSPTLSYHQQPHAFGEDVGQVFPQTPAEPSRFLLTLSTYTARVKTPDDIPVTYLNKGQAYTLNIQDTMLTHASPNPNTYRTFVRISFDNAQQRQNPVACWQLWKEGRGLKESGQRGGRLQAVEFVESTQMGAVEVAGRPHVELEAAYFDGFVVRWTPAPNHSPECQVALRCNFLSTDFSHSKGVKGIPVRLCAKTEILNAQQLHAGSVDAPPTSEIRYCMVKLFRDHGAERKLANDEQHLEKLIDRIKQTIQKNQDGSTNHGDRKRPRSGSFAKPIPSSKPGKVPKQKRKISVTSDPGRRGLNEDDPHYKLQILTRQLTAPKETSVLYLKGDEFDDPDLFPVHLPGHSSDIPKLEIKDDTIWEKQSNAGNSSGESPTPSSASVHSFGRRDSRFQQPAPFNPLPRTTSDEWRSLPGQTATHDLPGTVKQEITPSNLAVKVPAKSGDDAELSFIESVDVDPTYRPPPERAIKPIACFYVQPRIQGETSKDGYYRAIYLMQRTLKDLNNHIASKCEIEPTQVVRTLRINHKGLEILLDDEAIQEMPEGQDMIAKFEALREHSPPSPTWDTGNTEIQVDGDVGAIRNVTTSGYELRLYY